MEFKVKRTLGIGLAATAALVLASCSRSTVSVSVILPLTGEFASYGVSIQKGIDLASSEIRALPDFKPKIDGIEISDSKSDPKRAAQLLERDLDKGALAAIGGVTTDEAKAMIPVADKYQTLLLSPSASAPELSGVSKNFYRIWPSDQSEATKLAQSAYGQLGLRSVAVVSGAEAYGRGARDVFKAAFEAQGGKVVEAIEYPADSTDLSGEAVQVVELKPEAVFVAGYGHAIGRLVKELRHHQFAGKILTTSAFASPAEIEKIGKDAEGVLLAQTRYDIANPQEHARQFVAAFKTKYGEDPDIYAAYGYDAMKVLAKAIEGRQILASDIAAGLRSDALKGYEGVGGPIEFDEKGDVKKSPRLYAIGGDLALTEYTASTAPAAGMPAADPAAADPATAPAVPPAAPQS